MATPRSQKHDQRPISFLLWDTINGVLDEHSFVIRPEELSKQDPSRNSVQQTFGGAWLDSFGEGISQINISGTTGWKGANTLDGSELFALLRNACFEQWHRRRAENVKNGINPDNIQLIFTDFLDDIAVVCAPMQFTLKRHKSRPLLMQFNINMLVLGGISDNAREASIDMITNAITHPKERRFQAQIALEEGIEKQKELAEEIKEFASPLTDSMSEILEFSAEALEEVQSIADEVVGEINAVTAPVLKIVSDIQQASRNVMQILTTAAGVGEFLKILIQDAASSLNDSYCNIINGFSVGLTFPDYSDLFGASTCSSTGGGRPISPYARENPWLSIYEVDDPVSTPSVTTSASSALSELLLDPLSSTLSTDEVLSLAEDVRDGITLVS